jgi:GNAT superfamily N-acetyltransferase
MSDLRVRFARSTDAGKAGAIMSEFIDETAWMPRIHTRAEDIGLVGSMIGRDWVTVALQGEQLVGFLARERHDIHALYIASSAWRQGAGSALLRHAQDVTPKLSLWTFQANESAKAFYLAHGFREVERTDGAENDENLPDIRFEWHKELV